MKKLILIDGNALVHRAFHALPPLTSPRGIVTNAVFGFSSILLKTIKDLKPDYIAAAFDLAGPTFRHKEFAEYKIHRERAPDELYNQIPLVKDMLGAFGVPVYEKQGYEADDLIGTLATETKNNPPAGGVQVVIATGDLDTLQLVEGEKVVVFTLKKGMNDTVIYDERAVMARYGLKPGQLNDYRGLKGDPSDNIPGVPGIGEKTAADLIQKFGSLDGLYKSLEKQKTKGKRQKVKGEVSEKLAGKLLENKERAYFSKQLSTLVTDLDTDFSLGKADWRKNMDQSKIETIFKELGFNSLLKRLQEIGLPEQSAMVFEKEAPDMEELNFDPNKNNIYVVTADEKKTQKNILTSPDAVLIGHDLKDLFKSLISRGKHIKNKVFDTKIAAYLLNPDLREYDFDKVYYLEFKETPSEDPLKKPAYLWKLKEHLWEKIKSADLIKIFEDVEMPLIKVLAEMELNGIKIKTEILKKLLTSTNKELAKLESKIYKLAGASFNINSPSQLGEILFSKLQIKGKVRRTGGGAMSTAAPELEKLRDEHPIIDLVLQYRELQKLKTTYIEPFPLLVDKSDGRLHTTYNQTGTGTGRLASQDPNLQNIPIRTELGQEFRKAFVAERGCHLLSLDYSQIELRIVAHVAQDKKMIEAFRNSEDIHTRTAAEIFEVAPEKVTKEMRRQAKVLNFGIIYGMGSVGFARAAGVDRLRAREFITKYLDDFSGVARYMEKTKEEARRNGYVETLFGRRRQILDIYSTIPQVQAQAERMAINHPIQGTAADLMKMAMIGVYDFIHENLKENEVKMLLQVHDELVCEVREKLVAPIASELKKIMGSVHQLDIPLVVDVKYGENWQEIAGLGQP
ncbi:MAG: DNA polymerase I [Patescibacteria group bacterium]